ncbi:MAG: HPP family protein [Planctomycetes bacterium]|nr:HPP family protein [Planctomycetota bacterium]
MAARNTLIGHAVGILCGYASLWLMGLTERPSAMVEGVHLQRVFCAALSLEMTGALTTLLDASHPRAGATTLIIALGIITQPYHLLIIVISVVVLLLQAFAINRLAGLDFPIWAPRSGGYIEGGDCATSPSSVRGTHGSGTR